MVVAQGGDADALERMAEVHGAPFIGELKASQSGRLERMDAEIIGRTCILLGAGRATAGDSIDHAVGVDRIAKCGSEVKAGDVLLRVHARTQQKLDEALAYVRGAPMTAAP
jgi:thymidine phosphorylase